MFAFLCAAGLQTQTAECLVIAEVATPHMVVALNKVDMLPEADRVKAIKRAYKKLMQTFQMTKFADATMVPVAAKPGQDAVVDRSRKISLAIALRM
jgi:selenocysteine-specific elongation factor